MASHQQTAVARRHDGEDRGAGEERGGASEGMDTSAAEMTEPHHQVDHDNKNIHHQPPGTDPPLLITEREELGTRCRLSCYLPESEILIP